MIRSTIGLAAALALLAGAAAQAQTAKRAWVSGHGTDAPGCGAPTSPCRSFQYTHDNIVAAGGEIDVLDPAGFGAITLTKSLSIVNDGAGTAGVIPTSGGNGITINAPGATIVLRGLAIEGQNGSVGVDVVTGGALFIQDCTIDGFGGDGVLYAPTAPGALVVSRTRITNNLQGGVFVTPAVQGGVLPTVQVTLERVEVVNGGFGITVSGDQSSQSLGLSVTLADSIVADTLGGGAVESESQPTKAPVYVMVRNTAILNNRGTAVTADGAELDIARSTVSGNDTAFSAVDAGVLRSFSDNDVTANTSLGSTPATLPRQ